MRINKHLFSAILGLLSICGLYAQNATVTTGGEANGTNGSASYTVGQVVYSTYEGSNGSISEGVQQAYEIFAVSAPEITDINLDVTAFPNPTVDLLTLSVDCSKYSQVYLTLSDLSGKQIVKQSVVDDLTNIDVSNLIQSEYFLSVISEQKVIKTFKILKK